LRGSGILRVFALPRGAVTALAVAVAAVLAWRAVATGLDALSARSVARAQAAAGALSGPVGQETASRQHLARNPADANALLALALALERQGRRDDASAAIRATLGLAPADPQVLIRIAGYFLRSGDEAQALATFKRAADAAPGDPNDVVARALLAGLDTGRHREFFDGIARANPVWWPGFFRLACAQAADAGTVAAVLAVRAQASVASSEEWRCVIERLQREGQWARAHQLWLNSLPLDQRQRIGYVFNGGFEWPISGIGFDWIVPAQDGVVVSTERSDGTTGQRALSVAFADKRFGEPPIHQHLLLVPGRHRLEGRSRTELESRLGLQWGVYCEDGRGRAPRQLARSERLAGSAEWKAFRVDFLVPGDCPVQRLRLELANPGTGAITPAPSAARIKGTVWFDDLRILVLD